MANRNKLPTLTDLLVLFLKEEYKDLRIDVWDKEFASSAQIRINLLDPETTLVIIYPDTNEAIHVSVKPQPGALYDESYEPWTYRKFHPGDPAYLPNLKKMIALAYANRMKWHDQIQEGV